MLLYHYCFATLYLRAISNYKPPGGFFRRGDLTKGFFALRVWGPYIWRGLYMEGLIYGILRYPQENKHLAPVVQTLDSAIQPLNNRGLIIS